MSSALDSAAATVGVLASTPLAGDAAQLPRFAWSAEVMAAGPMHPFLTLRWGYDSLAASSFVLVGAGVEVGLFGNDALRLVLASAPFAGLGLPRNSFGARRPAFDLGVVAGPRLRIALGRAMSGASMLVGVPLSGTWTAVPSTNFVEPGQPYVGLGIGGEIGLALPL